MTKIKIEFPDLPVLALTKYFEERYGVQMIQAKASGYLVKTCASDVLPKAIRDVLAGKAHLSSKMGKLLTQDSFYSLDCAGHEVLTEHEYQVMCLIDSRKTASEIAGELSLKAATISSYRANILENES